MSRDTEPQRGNQFSPVMRLNAAESAAYQKWYKSQPKKELEEIPLNELSDQMNKHEPLYDFGEDADFAIKSRGGDIIAGGSVLALIFPDKKRVGELTGVYVSEPYRRQGLGSKIGTARMNWCIEQGFESLQTHIASTNIPSLW